MNSLRSYNIWPLCRKSFDEGHAAARIPTCFHVFGLARPRPSLESCLLNSPKCPFGVGLLVQSFENADPEAHFPFIQLLWINLFNYRSWHGYGFTEDSDSYRRSFRAYLEYFGVAQSPPHAQTISWKTRNSE